MLDSDGWERSKGVQLFSRKCLSSGNANGLSSFRQVWPHYSSISLPVVNCNNGKKDTIHNNKRESEKPLLAKPLQNLNVLLLEPILCCLDRRYVLGHCHAGRPIHDPSSVFWLKEGGSRPRFYCIWPVHQPLNTVKSSCTLRRVTALEHNVSTSVLDCIGMVFLGS